ncbi:MAG: sulfatase-like hydrolase/transferase [Paludibacteraceae bacterium]|nr:sulfatase-like hydrolase/transferase [Paludibacteraceae bacterium]
MNGWRNWITFGLFTLLIFGQTLLFDHFAFYEWSFALTPVQQCMMIVYKLAAAMLFASPVFLLRDSRWLILWSVIIDTWFVANLIYMRNNHILLDGEAFNMSGNLHGYFWSVLIYIEWSIDLIFYGMTAVFGWFLWRLKKSERSFGSFLIVFALGIVPLVWERHEHVYGQPFPQTVAATSLLYAPYYIVADYRLMSDGIQPDRPMTEEDLVLADSLNSGSDSVQMDSPLIIVLLESLENWVVTPQIMPNLYRLTNNDHVFYANRIHTQIVGAPSADGQMLVNTGLLPITAGGTCLHYWRHTYPAIMKLAPDNAVCLLPHDTCVWNQTHMSPAYGYDTTICYSDIDTILFRKLDSLVDDGWRYIQCITQSTHAPFVNEKYSHLDVPHSMPWVMYNFIRGFNALDDGLGVFLRKLETDPKLQQYTIVITGDHRILHREKRNQMQRYADRLDDPAYDWINSLNPTDDCLPLIIYSPKISGNPRYTHDAYQMDIYPTYRSLVGAEDCRWKGFGINLMDSTQKRALPEEDAYRLSDKMIRNDYFPCLSR